MDEWIRDESIGFYEVRESSHAHRHDPIAQEPTYKVISMLVMRVARHGDYIHQVEMDRDSLTRDIR